MNLFFYHFACNQIFNLAADRRFIRLLDKTSYCLIAAGIGPVILRLCVCVRSKSIAVIYHIPRTVDFCISKLIAIVPFFYLIIMTGQLIIIQQFFYFSVGETKSFVNYPLSKANGLPAS